MIYFLSILCIVLFIGSCVLICMYCNQKVKNDENKTVINNLEKIVKWEMSLRHETIDRLFMVYLYFDNQIDFNSECRQLIQYKNHITSPVIAKNYDSIATENYITNLQILSDIIDINNRKLDKKVLDVIKDKEAEDNQ